VAWKSGKAYAQDLRDRVFLAADEAIPVGQIAERLSVSVSYVSKVLSRRRLTGERVARPQCCHVPRKLAAYHTAIREQVKARPDATLQELRAWLLETHKVSASIKLIWETLAQLRLTLKKRPCTRRSRTERTLRRPAPNGVNVSPA
jgi:transposase